MRHIESPTTAYVNALVGVGGPLLTIVDHMRRFGEPGPGDPAIPEVLTRILLDVVDSDLHRPPDDLYSAAALLEATAEAIEAYVGLVDPDELP